ncbi:MAG: hypothetical protein ACTSP0_07720 [Alphaproteobacteria bacterium]
MFKKILLTTVAALAITAGATSISTPDANAGVKLNLNFGGGGHWGGGHWGGYGGHGHGYGYGCGSYKVRIKYWHAGHGHFHKKWVWRSYC